MNFWNYGAQMAKKVSGLTQNQQKVHNIFLKWPQHKAQKILTFCNGFTLKW